MKCYFHPEEEAVGVCVSCGKGVCMACQRKEDDKIYCKDCYEEPYDWFGFKFGFKDFGRAFQDFMFSFGRCPNCHKPIRGDFVVCPYCQTNLRGRCEKCGRRLRPDWVVCPYCGESKQ